MRVDVSEGANREEVEKLVAAKLTNIVRSEREKHLELRGTFEGAPLFLRFERTPLQRGGTRPFLEVVVEEDLGATIELRGAHGLHLATDAPVAFTSEALADVVLVGAPHALVRDIASVLDPKLAAMHAAGAEVITLEIGPYAERAGIAKRGIRLVARGWPLDDEALDHLLGAVIDTRAKIEAAGPKLERHREVIAHERSLVFGPGTDAKRKLTKRIALIGVAFLVAALLLSVIASKLGP